MTGTLKEARGKGTPGPHGNEQHNGPVAPLAFRLCYLITHTAQEPTIEDD